MHNFDKPPLITPEVPPAYRGAIKAVSEAWDQPFPEYSEAAGSPMAYTAMRNVLTNRMIAADPSVEKVAKSKTTRGVLPKDPTLRDHKAVRRKR